MNLYFRMLLVLLHAWRRKSLTPLDESGLTLRVLPTDLNIHGNMHAGRYLNVMELGYLDLATRMGLLALMWKQYWRLRIVAVNIHYVRPLKLLQRYQLYTKVLCWDNQWIYLEQRFEYDKKTIAIGQIKVAISGRSSNIAPGYLLELLGYDPASPTMPATIQQWTKAT